MSTDAPIEAPDGRRTQRGPMMTLDAPLAAIRQALIHGWTVVADGDKDYISITAIHDTWDGYRTSVVGHWERVGGEWREGSIECLHEYPDLPGEESFPNESWAELMRRRCPEDGEHVRRAHDDDPAR